MLDCEFGIRFSKEFLDSEVVSYIFRQSNGFKYWYLFERLCLKAIKTNGYFITKIGEMTISSTPEILSEDIKFINHDNIVWGLKLLESVGLISNENGVFRINNFESFLWSESCSE